MLPRPHSLHTRPSHSHAHSSPEGARRATRMRIRRRRGALFTYAIPDHQDPPPICSLTTSSLPYANRSWVPGDKIFAHTLGWRPSLPLHYHCTGSRNGQLAHIASVNPSDKLLGTAAFGATALSPAFSLGFSFPTGVTPHHNTSSIHIGEVLLGSPPCLETSWPRRSSLI